MGLCDCVWCKQSMIGTCECMVETRTNKGSSEESYLQTHQRNKWLPQEPSSTTHISNLINTYPTLPALMCVCSHMISHVSIFTSVMHSEKTGGFFLFMLCTYLMVYIMFITVSFSGACPLLISCSRKPYLQSEMLHSWLCTHTVL